MKNEGRMKNEELAAADEVDHLHRVAVVHQGFIILAGLDYLVVDPDNQELECKFLVLKQLCNCQAVLAGNLFRTVI